MTMTDQRIEADDEFDAAWDEPTTAPDDDHAVESDNQDEFDNESDVEDQTPETGISEDVSTDDEAIALAEQRAKSAEGRLRKLEEQHAQYQQELQALRKGATPAPVDEKKDAPASDGKPTGMSEEEWTEFQDDFPDIAKAMKAQGDQINEVRSAVGEVKAQREQEQQHAQAELTRKAQEAHDSQIRKAHSDYDRIAADPKRLIDFVEAQPPLQKRIYKDVMEKGSPEEIIELLDEYKSETSASTSKRPSLAIKTRKSRPSLNAAAKADPNDYDAAWDEAVRAKP